MVFVKGPKGELSEKIHEKVLVEIKPDEILVSVNDKENKSEKALWGLSRSLINNMVLGVTQGFKKDLEIEGVGYRGEMQGDRLVLSLGFSHPVPVDAPKGIKLSVDKSQRILTIEGTDKQMVGEVAAKIRALRPPEPYKGKGIHYLGEKVRRKAGKAGKVGAK